MMLNLARAWTFDGAVALWMLVIQLSSTMIDVASAETWIAIRGFVDSSNKVFFREEQSQWPAVEVHKWYFLWRERWDVHDKRMDYYFNPCLASHKDFFGNLHFQAVAKFRPSKSDLLKFRREYLHECRTGFHESGIVKHKQDVTTIGMYPFHEIECTLVKEDDTPDKFVCKSLASDGDANAILKVLAEFQYENQGESGRVTIDEQALSTVFPNENKQKAAKYTIFLAVARFVIDGTN
jgi:hypothetical protein